MAPKRRDETRLPLLLQRSVLVPGEWKEWNPQYADQYAQLRQSRAGDTGFAMCLALPSEDPGWRYRPADVGTEFVVADFAVDAPGELVLKMRGERRFRVLNAELAEGCIAWVDVEWLDGPESDLLVARGDQHELFAVAVRGWMEQHKLHPFYPGYTETWLDDANWLSWRAMQIFHKFDQMERLAMLRQSDPIRRMDTLCYACIRDTLDIETAEHWRNGRDLAGSV